MRSHGQIEADARPGRAFSNGTEFEIWQFNVCMGGGHNLRRCINDDSIDEDGGCPLIALSLADLIPAEWTGPHGRYRCTAKITAAQQHAVDAAELRRRVDESHYPMFDIEAS